MQPIPDMAQRLQHRALGDILYTDYIFFFQVAGLILLVAMIGAIVLTLRHKAERQAPGHLRGRLPARRQRRSRSKRSNRARGSDAATALEAIMTIGISHYLTVTAILFTLGMFGIFLNRKNVIVILMSVELILLAVNLNFVAFSAAPRRSDRARSSRCSC